MARQTSQRCSALRHLGLETVVRLLHERLLRSRGACQSIVVAQIQHQTQHQQDTQHPIGSTNGWRLMMEVQRMIQAAVDRWVENGGIIQALPQCVDPT